ncbi:hypothetical protein ACQZV8_19610 [Magnetococcales bacterium HHB-1]
MSSDSLNTDSFGPGTYPVTDPAHLNKMIFAKDYVDESSGKMLAVKSMILTPELVERLHEHGINEVLLEPVTDPIHLACQSRMEKIVWRMKK